MMLNIVFSNSCEKDKKYSSKFFEKILSIAIKELGLSGKKVEISINLVGNYKMRELNKKYRHKNKTTDVLSFPMLSKKLKDLKTGIHEAQFIDLGDVFICYPFAKKAIKRENINIDTKIRNLTIHGLLHLLGYDHEKSVKEAEKMFELEKNILRKIQVF